MVEFNSKELKIIDAARLLFYRHGFKRVTMHDIAMSCDMSRPALYLIFPNKEVIFEAVVRHSGAKILDLIQVELSSPKNIADKLRFAFEQWTVRPFEAILQSPDARDLIECSHGFARAAVNEITTEFEAMLRGVLAEVTPPRSTRFSAAALAHLLVASMHGFKTASSSADELRELIGRQINLTLAALENQTAAKRQA